jgi:SNF2 family DNA or RNA helicase
VDRVCPARDSLVAAASSVAAAPVVIDLTEPLERERTACLDRARDWLLANRSFQFFDRVLKTVRAGEESVTCPVCLDDLQGRDVAISPCGHVYCLVCGRETRVGNKCSVCRSVFEGRHFAIFKAQRAQASNEELRVNYGSKMDTLSRLLTSILSGNDEKVIIFTQFESLRRSVMEMMADMATRNAIGFTSCLAGSARRRAGIIGRFRHNPSHRILVMSVEQCASGVDLTRARHVVFLHPFMATSKESARDMELQATGRVQRHGQTRQVHVWRLVTKDTVEETLMR